MLPPSLRRSAPWESCGIRLCVRPRALGLTVVRAWYGGPHNHKGKIYDIRESASWLWQTGTKKGKDVTEIVRAAMRSDSSLDFNRERRGCNEIFDFGGDWGCWKILAVEYRYGAGSVKTWFSQSVPHEPHACFLPASDDRQRWMQAGSLIQHVVGGHALDVNFWRLEKGAGVNLNAPIVGIKTFYWVVASPNAISEAPAARSGKKCASPNCAFQAHHVSADWNGNGMYCCAACTTSQGHGLRCLRVLDVPVASIKLADLAGEWMRDYHEFGEELVRIAIEGVVYICAKHVLHNSAEFS